MNISVVVVSRNRPEWLARCLLAVRQLDYPAFEVVVVADRKSLEAVDCTGLKTTIFETPNISAARNRGIDLAAGEACAFIDDDAVPEPLWLQHHEIALVQTGADASLGYVRGRNGISFQSRVASVDCEAETHEEPRVEDDPFLPVLEKGRALKLIGTNSVVRRSTLRQLGGYDPAFRFFLDDTDMSIRLANAGFVAAVAPLAEVHHGFAPSKRRTRLRAPRDLFDIGRSSAIFFRRHKPRDFAELFARIERRERARAERHLVAGTIEPRDVGRLLATLYNGWDAGMSEALPELPRIAETPNDFCNLSAMPRGHLVLKSRLLRRKSTLRTAESEVANRRRASVFSFSLTPVRHHVRYTGTGVWLQTGGQFGRSRRKGRFFKWCRFAQRSKEESQRVAKIRGI